MKLSELKKIIKEEIENQIDISEFGKYNKPKISYKLSVSMKCDQKYPHAVFTSPMFPNVQLHICINENDTGEISLIKIKGKKDFEILESKKFSSMSDTVKYFAKILKQKRVELVIRKNSFLF